VRVGYAHVVGCGLWVVGWLVSAQLEDLVCASPADIERTFAHTHIQRERECVCVCKSEREV
jgi:hypothetical protein